METHHYASETVTVKCRVRHCQMTLMRKNYKEHLSKRHPKENPLDLTPFGQGKISSFFSLGLPTVRRQGDGRPQEIIQKSPEEDHPPVEGVTNVEEIDPPSFVDSAVEKHLWELVVAEQECGIV